MRAVGDDSVVVEVIGVGADGIQRLRVRGDVDPGLPGVPATTWHNRAVLNAHKYLGMAGMNVVAEFCVDFRPPAHPVLDPPPPYIIRPVRSLGRLLPDRGLEV